ncbi:MAG: FGGY-family carbohydrate kinase [Rhodobacteraceae bacterium]|nr:FGGY-family carbohydrate kinase [Paracoccaceae bacterium]
MTLTLGIDIGTFESKGVVVDEAGRVVAEARQPHEMLVPRPGWAEHRPEEDWWGDFVRITRQLLAAPGVRAEDIAAVAASAIGPCMLPVDAEGRPLMNGVLYGVDTRASAEIAELTARIGAETILETCGNALTSQSVGPKILWLSRNCPEIFANCAKILTSTSYLTWKLTGEYVIDHYTAANFSPFYDVGRLDWTDDLAPGIVPRDRLPRLMWSTGIAGRVTAAAAAETGLAEGTPVTCGTIDAAAEAVSVGVRAPGDMMVMYGSTIFMIMLTEARLRDARLFYAPWLFPGEHASMAGLATSGTLTHWFRDRFARELPRESAFAALAAEAEASPKGAKGLLCLPYFSGERTPIHDPLAKGAFFGLNLTHDRGDLYRAVLEGIAMGTAHVADTWREAGAAPARVLAVGGGTRNAVWMQATSDLTGLTQIVSRTTVGASYGDAFLAALAVGAVAREDIARWNPPEREVRPERVAAYERQYPLFRRLYAATREIAHALG